MKLDEATVLVVDDEPMLRLGYATWLRRGGCQRILTAANGAEALEIFLHQQIDLLVSDVRMPVLDGIGLLERINASGKRIPGIIFVSGFSTIETRVAYSLGAEAFLAKPFTAPTLLGAVTQSLAAREELWATPLQERPLATMVVEAADADGARSWEEWSRLRFGRGGFSCQVKEPWPLSPMIFKVCVGQESGCIEGEGYIRWFCREQQRVGVEFHYLAPETRPQALVCVAERCNSSFIPL